MFGRICFPDMINRVEYHPEARKELTISADWYEKRIEGLGLEFLLEVKSAETEILQFPEMPAVYEDKTRRYLLSRFPFGIIYQIHVDSIQIIAVAHCKRLPGYWKRRVT